MGFNKKWLTNELIHTTYNNSGLLGIKKNIETADALICEEGLSSEIMDLLLEDNDNTAHVWDKILQLIIKDKNGQ